MDFRGMLRHELETTVDPHVAADAVIARIKTYDDAIAALALCLPYLARDIVRQARVMPGTEAGQQGMSRSPRWERARADYLSSRYYVGGKWKELAVCTAADCSEIATDYERRAEQNAAWAARFRELAAHMIECGATYVQDLDAAALAGVAA